MSVIRFKKYVVPAVTLLLFVSASVSGCGSKGDTISLEAVEDFTHAESGITFPGALGRFNRGPLIESESPTAYYTAHLAGEAVQLTLSIRKNPDYTPELFKAAQDAMGTTEALSQRFESMKDNVIASGTDDEFRYIAAYDVSLVRDEKPYWGKRAYFRIEDGAFADVYIYEYGAWFVEYTAFYPRDLEHLAVQFIADHVWNAQP